MRRPPRVPASRRESGSAPIESKASWAGVPWRRCTWPTIRGTSRTVAIKVLRAEVAGVLSRERFAREIAIVARLDHPRILPLYESGSLTRDDGTPVVYYAMPCMSGRSLRERLDEEPQLPIDEAVMVAREVAAALDACPRRAAWCTATSSPRTSCWTRGPGRGRRLRHRPGARRGRAASGSPRPAWSLGTPAYMSPEQAMREAALDGRSRHLRAGLRALRDARRDAALHGVDVPGDLRPPCGRPGAPAGHGASRGSPWARAHRAPGVGEGAREPVPLRGRVRGRPHRPGLVALLPAARIPAWNDLDRRQVGDDD